MKNSFFKAEKPIIPISRIILLISILFLCINFSACASFANVKDFFTEKFSNEEEMDKAVETIDIFFSLLIEKNFKEAYQYISSEDKIKGNQQKFSNEFADVTDIVSVDINWVEVKNNIAIVGIDLTESYDGEEKVFKDIEVSLIKEEDGSWKIVFWN